MSASLFVCIVLRRRIFCTHAFLTFCDFVTVNGVQTTESFLFSVVLLMMRSTLLEMHSIF